MLKGELRDATRPATGFPNSQCRLESRPDRDDQNRIFCLEQEAGDGYGSFF
jgi:hypothetical protein